MRRILIVVAAAAVAAAAGCASVGDRGAAAADVAVRMLRAAQTGDGSTACALLAPDTVAAIERSAGKPCPEAILDEDLPRPAAVTATQVYGQRAQVRLTGDTVFLGAFPGGWRVVAAGCVPRDGRPYDCTVQGA